MPEPVFTSLEQRPLRDSDVIWCIAVVALAILPQVKYLPIWISALALILLLFRYGMCKKMRLPYPRLMLAITSVVATAGVMADYHTLVGRDAGIAMFVIMLSLKLLETRHLRDGMLVMFLSYFLAMTIFFYEQTILLSGYVLATVGLITTGLIRLNAGKLTTSFVPALKSAGGMLAFSLPIMLILFILFPRISGPLWSMPSNKSTGVSGLSNEMTPGNISDLIQSNAVAFRVTFDTNPPPAQDRYWRGPVLWNFDGRTWRRRLNKTSDTIEFSNVNNSIDNDSIEYTVTLEPNNKPWLFALDIPITLPDQARINNDYLLLAPKPLAKRTQYKMKSQLRYTINPELSNYERELALRLPANLAPRARKLAQSWRTSNNQDSGVIQQALRHFNQQPFTYTLSPPLLKQDAVDDFLFETRRGFCEHFSSSFVVLMRAAGIPARVVTGYQGGEWNPIGNYLLIRQSDAHAWAEVWLRDQGWKRIDPTAAVSPDRIERGISNALGDDEALPFFVRSGYSTSLVNRLSLVWDNINYRWDDWVLAFGPEKQRALMARLGFQDGNWQHLIILMISGLAALLTVYALIFAWRYRSPPADPLTKLYQHFTAKMSKGGLQRQRHEGPIDYAQRVSQQRPELGDSVTLIARLYSRLRYSPHFQQKDFMLLKRLIQQLRV